MRLRIGLFAAAALTLGCAQFSRADYMSIAFDTGGTLTSPTGTLNYAYSYTDTHGTHKSSGSIAETEITSQYDSLGATDGYLTNVSPTPLTFTPSPTAWILEDQANAANVADLIVFNVHTLYIYPVSDLSSSKSIGGHSYDLKTVSGLSTYLGLISVAPVLSPLEAQENAGGYGEEITGASANKSGQMQYDGSGVPLTSFINFGSGSFAPALTTAPLPSVASGGMALIGFLAAKRRRQIID